MRIAKPIIYANLYWPGSSFTQSMVSFDEMGGAENAAGQVEGATRSTIVNLFHLVPLRYDSLPDEEQEFPELEDTDSL